MGWEKPERNTVSLQKKPVGTVYEGVYQGSRIVKTELGDSILYSFMDDEDHPFSVWGFSHLNFQMEGVTANSKCRITYAGKAAQKNKFGKFPHQASVEVWKDDDDDSVLAE